MGYYGLLGIMNYLGVDNRIDILELKACPFENLGLDSGFRRRDEFEASSLFVIPAPHQVRDKLQPESSGIEEEFDVYTITALLVTNASKAILRHASTKFIVPIMFVCTICCRSVCDG
jgi:hypothetical protein